MGENKIKRLSITSISVILPLVVMASAHAAVLVVGSAKGASDPHLVALCALSMTPRVAALMGWRATHNRLVDSVAEATEKGDTEGAESSTKSGGSVLILVLGMFFFIGVPVYAALFAFAMGVL